jgi:hypothetical protein
VLPARPRGDPGSAAPQDSDSLTGTYDISGMTPDDLPAIQNISIAILIGASVGIEREKRRDTDITIGGIRTFARMRMYWAADRCRRL